MTSQHIVFDQALIKRYDNSRPRYSSYPSSFLFHDGFCFSLYLLWAVRTNPSSPPLSLFFLLPFSNTSQHHTS